MSLLKREKFVIALSTILLCGGAGFVAYSHFQKKPEKEPLEPWRLVEKDEFYEVMESFRPQFPTYLKSHATMQGKPEILVDGEVVDSTIVNFDLTLNSENKSYYETGNGTEYYYGNIVPGRMDNEVKVYETMYGVDSAVTLLKYYVDNDGKHGLKIEIHIVVDHDEYESENINSLSSHGTNLYENCQTKEIDNVLTYISGKDGMINEGSQTGTRKLKTEDGVEHDLFVNYPFTVKY